MRANGLRSSALPSCPMSHSKSCQSRKARASSRARGASSPKSRRGRRRVSTPASTHSPPASSATGAPAPRSPWPSPLHVLGQLEVGGADQARVRHVDEPVTQHVGPQQYLAVPALEVPQVQAGARQPHRIAVKAAHLVDGHEDLPPADRGHQAGDERVVGAAEPDDDIGQASDRFAAAVRHRPFEQPGQTQRDLGVGRGLGPGGGRRCGHGWPLPVRTVMSSPARLVSISMPCASAPAEAG